MKEFINGRLFRLMIESASSNLENSKIPVNDLNVFPVPDGDTGTNMSLTFTGAFLKVNEMSDNSSVGEVTEILSNAALRNARGNSGVILSQLIRGLSKVLKGKTVIKIFDLAEALKSASDNAYRAVMKPTEGTILTVARDTAEFAVENCTKYTDIEEFFGDVLKASKKSLENTPNLLPVLKQANVVDAGGMGLYLLLEGAYYALANNKAVEKMDKSLESQLLFKAEKNIEVDIKYTYCTEFIINKSSDRAVTQFKAAIEPKGDSILVIDGGDIVKVHIHTNNPGFVLQKAITLGELSNIKIDNMKYQHDEILEESKRNDKVEETPQTPPKKYGIVAVAAGDGMVQLFRDMGADSVVKGGQTMNPSTEDLLNSVQNVNAETVFILPNNKNIVLSAEQVVALCDKNVIVIPTKSIPQGLSSMVVFSEEMSAEENKEAMTECIESVKTIQITFAARDSMFEDLEIKQGDIMGMLGSQIQKIGSDPNTMCLEMVDENMTDNISVISVFYGEEVNQADAEEVLQKVTQKYPKKDIILHEGGQPLYYYIISLE